MDDVLSCHVAVSKCIRGIRGIRHMLNYLIFGEVVRMGKEACEWEGGGARLRLVWMAYSSKVHTKM